jgi:thiamine pyridinylase
MNALLNRCRSLLLLLPLIAACSPPSPPAPPTRLRVPLYPFIPDAAGDQFKSLAERLEAEFEQLHPEVDLDVNPACMQDEFYEPSAMARSLSGQGDCPYELIETDATVLGELVATGALRPWPRLPAGVDWHPASLTASIFQGTLYGVPHWMCNHFVISRGESVRQARTVSALVQALQGLGTPAPDMASNLLGSWNLPSLYLDAWMDTRGPEGIESAVSTTYDPQVLQSLRTFVRTCQGPEGNPCIDGTYDLGVNFDLPAQLFARGQADATMGYSERLHTIIKNLPAGASRAELKISSAPLGEGSRPILFTDSFFLSASCTGACERAALAFVDYMSRGSTFEWLMMSGDAPESGRVPRYLMAASLDAYKAPQVAADPLYQVVDAETRSGAAFPNSGLYDIRTRMTDDLVRALSEN